jgi:hypothetical protein
MKKSKELKLFQIELLKKLEEFDILVATNLKKIKKEYQQIIIDEKIELLSKICEGEKLNFDKLKSKYLNYKELTLSNENTIPLQDNEEMLDKIKIDDVEYYYENKENGKVFNINNDLVGYIKNSNIVLNC